MNVNDSLGCRLSSCSLVFAVNESKRFEKMGGNFSEADRYVSISLLCNFSCVLAAY